MELWIDVAVKTLPLVLSGFAGWVAWSLRRRFVSHEDLRTKAAADEAANRKVQDDVGALDRRLIRVEEVVKHLPTTDDIQDLSRQISALAATTQGVNATVTGLAGEISAIRTQINMLMHNELQGGER